MGLDGEILTAGILLLFALLIMIALWILSVRKAYRLEWILEEILTRHGMTSAQIRAIIDGDATIEFDGGRR